MPWGEYKHYDIEDVPSDYLKWLIDKCENEDIRDAADCEYQWREVNYAHFYSFIRVSQR